MLCSVVKSAFGLCIYFVFAVFQRVRAAFFAIADRFLAESDLARALPPLSPPNRPSITAAGFLPLSSAGGTASGGAAPVVMSKSFLAN